VNEDERTLEILKLITSAEHHFNNLCFNIRALASTWLLATLAGVGWILKDLPTTATENSFVIDKVDLLIVLCVASSIGIFVLWIMDIMVYQRLLNVWFDSRKQYELDDNFPPIREKMKYLFETGRATELIMIYYLALTAGPLMLAMFIAKSAGETVLMWTVLLILFVIITIIYKYSPKDKNWMNKK
jgi:hypothetical protein